MKLMIGLIIWYSLRSEKMKKILFGRLELDITANSYGEHVYTVELFNKSGKSLFKQVEEYLDENVKITIEKLPAGDKN
jgi:hypothetical protein